MNANDDQKIKAAYALNLWTVSVSQIIDYDDIVIMDQEYDTIINNLNLERMPKDEALLDIIKRIMDQITFMRMEAGDRKLIEREYQYRLRNAVWSAVPNVAAIFATSNPIAMGVTLATQVGIGYMNYRRNKAEYELGYEKSKWQIDRHKMQHLNGLQMQLFETAWRLADVYKFPDEYRLTQAQISEYNKALMESNPVKRYNNLNVMKSAFSAYPAFWYQIGSTANNIYRSDLFASDIEIQERYKAYAIECFEKYRQLNKFNLLKHDILTSSWALEYLELQNFNQNNYPAKARELIGIAEKHSGGALDVLELCAFAYLRIQDYDNAARLFHDLVNKNYNVIVNTQILSGLYIKQMRSGDSKQAAEARIEYKQLPKIVDEKYILKMPPEGMDLSKWKPKWNRGENLEEFIDKQKEESKKEKERLDETKRKASIFYQQPILLVYTSPFEATAEYFLGVLNENRQKINQSLPSPSRCELKDYKQNREEIERRGTHIIMVGDSGEARKFYKNAKNGRWDYYHLGMRYVSYGNKTVLLARALKDEQINDLILLAREVNQKYPMKIPSEVESVNYTFMKEMLESFEGNFNDIKSTIETIITGITKLPLIVAGQTKESIKNTKQYVQNLAAYHKLEFLQYCIAIYKYLESENAVIE